TRWPRDWSSDVCSSDLGPMAREHLLQAPDAELRSAHLRAEVTQEGGRAVVHPHEVREVAPLDPARVELERREAHPLRPDVGRVRSEERRVGKEQRARWT